MKIKSYQTIMPEYQETITQLEKTIKMLNQSVLDKYNGLEYRSLYLYEPYVWYKRMVGEQLLVTEGVRKLLDEVLSVATEHCVVVKF